MAAAREPVWEVREVVKDFPGVRALDRVSLRLYPGSVHALVGENGSGKSTLANCLSGAYRPDAGTVAHRGQPLELHDPGAARRLGVSVFHQQLSLIPTLSVAENVCLGGVASPGGFVSWRQMRRDAEETLERLGVSIGLDRPVGDLSIAEQQLVEIARATLNPDITLLILDEPTAALGPDEVTRLHRVIRRFAQQAAVLYISHRLEEVLAIADVVTVLRDGRIVGDRSAADASVEETARMMIGGELEEYFASGRAGGGEQLLEALELRSAAMRFGVSFTVHKGEVLGLGGLTGSGRTKIVRAICGVDPVASGDVLLEGQSVRLRSPADAIGAGIAFSPENRKADALFFNLSLAQNISIAALDEVSRGGFLRLGTEDTRARGISQLLKLAPGTERRQVAFLSGGTQQKVVLGRWLFAGVKLLVLDEPTQGIDVGAKREIYAVIDELANQGIGVILVSSDYQELLSISDRVAVVCDGQIVHTAARGDLSQAELIELASSGDTRALA